MYKITLDESIIYYPGDKECYVEDAVVKLAVGQAGSCEFRVPPENPLYPQIQNRKSMVAVYRNDKEIFCGEVRESGKDNRNWKRVYAVGELAFLQDSIQPQHDYGSATPLTFLNAVISAHNGQVEARKQFSRGQVTVSSGSDASGKITDFGRTLDEIRSNLVNNLGGCLRVRKYGGTRYLDYVNLSDYGSANRQGINFGENLLDYSEDLSASDIVTVVIPLGTRLESDNETFEKRLNITSVNGGNNYVMASSSVRNRFGNVWKVVVFDGIEDAATLKAAGLQWLSENQYETMTLKVTAVDLANMDASLDDMALGDRIPCWAPPYGMDMTLPIQEMTLNLLAPEKDTIVLGATLKNKKLSISRQVGNSGRDIVQAGFKQEMKIRSYIQQEVANIMATFTGSQGGYKLSEYDSNGLWLRDLYMDTPNKSTATNIIEISMRGIRFSTGGYGAATSNVWKSAWTINGQFCADFIATGTLAAERIKAGILSDTQNKNYWNLETGEFSLAAAAKVGGKTVSTIAEEKVDAQTQQTIFNKLTNNGQTQGIYLQNGKLYLNAAYMATGILTDGQGITTWDLSNGDLETSKLKLSSTYLDITDGGTIKSKNGTEELWIRQAELIGKRNGAQIGKIDLSADTGNGPTHYDVAIASAHDVRLEIGSGGTVVFVQGNSVCGTIDGNGFHGKIDTSYLTGITGWVYCGDTALYLQNGIVTNYQYQ